MKAKQALRNWVKARARKSGLEIVRADRVPRTTLNLLHMSALALSASKPDFTLVQIGANDGVTRDPVRAIIHRLKPRAVLVEPVPHAFAALQLNYANVEGVSLVQAAVSERDGHMDLFVPAKGGSALGHQIASFSREHLLRHGVADADIRCERVRAVSLDTLLSEAGLDRVDVLQVDTEGHDWVILSSVLDAGHRPQIIHFENSGLEPASKRASRDRLSGEGYDIAETATDTLAVARSLLG